MNQDLKKRLGSLLWRTAMMALAFGIQYLSENLTDLSLSTELTTLIGLILGEISKQIYNIYRK